MAAEIVGNQSVYWRMTHRDKDGNKKNLKCQVPDRAAKGLPGADTIHVSNEAFAHDDIPYDDIGKKWRRHYFKVILRFPSNTEAKAELQSALDSIKDGKAATVLVPAIKRDSDHVDPADPAAEIEIDW